MSDDYLYLQHIVDAIAKIESHSAAGRNEFFEAPHWQDAIIRQVQIVGEATKRLSLQLREPWPRRVQLLAASGVSVS